MYEYETQGNRFWFILYVIYSVGMVYIASDVFMPSMIIILSQVWMMMMAEYHGELDDAYLKNYSKEYAKYITIIMSLTRAYSVFASLFTVYVATNTILVTGDVGTMVKLSPIMFLLMMLPTSLCHKQFLSPRNVPTDEKGCAV